MRVGVEKRGGHGKTQRESVFRHVARRAVPNNEHSPGVRSQHVTRGEQSRQQAETAEQRLARKYAGQEQRLPLGQPQDRDIRAGELERDGGYEQGHADGRENDKRDAPPARDRKLSQSELDGADAEQRVKRQTRLNRLVLHHAQQQESVEQSGQRGRALLIHALDAARDV